MKKVENKRYAEDGSLIVSELWRCPFFEMNPSGAQRHSDCSRYRYAGGAEDLQVRCLRCRKDQDYSGRGDSGVTVSGCTRNDAVVVYSYAE